MSMKIATKIFVNITLVDLCSMKGKSLASGPALWVQENMYPPCFLFLVLCTLLTPRFEAYTGRYCISNSFYFFFSGTNTGAAARNGLRTLPSF